MLVVVVLVVVLVVVVAFVVSVCVVLLRALVSFFFCQLCHCVLSQSDVCIGIAIGLCC